MNASLIADGDIEQVGSLTDPDNHGSGTVIKYGSIIADGFSLTNLSRSS